MTTLMHSLSLMTDDQLIEAYAAAQEAVENAADYRDRVDHVLKERMKARGATVILHPEFDVKLEAKTEYDQAVLVALREHVSPDMWREAWIPEQTVVKEGRLDMRRALKWEKAGEEVRAIIERAKVPTAPKLVVKKKGK